jgi:mono/diheme cytochrome c family protein
VNRCIKWPLITLATAAAIALCAAAADASAQTLIERGSYLVNGILTCGNCHTAKGPGGVPIADQKLAGGSQIFDGPSYSVQAANITPDLETGIGKWSEADIKRALQHGVRPNGAPLAPAMPSAFYGAFTRRDLDAVIAYVRSVPAVSHEVRAPIYTAALDLELERVPGAEKAVTQADLADPIKRGRYLTTIGHCFECHTPLLPNGRHDFSNSFGRGGQMFKGPFGVSVSRNITSDRTDGIGAWSDAEIVRAITQGISRDGSRLKPPMGFAWYARMTDEDLNAIVAYLRTVPPHTGFVSASGKHF